MAIDLLAVPSSWFPALRLDQRVAQQFGLSRRSAVNAVERGQVDVAGELCRDPAREVSEAEDVALERSRPRPETVNRKLRVLHEDGEILIIDKPAGLLTQPTTLREPDTLLERAGQYLRRVRGRERPYVGIVHRLDQWTSGVILVVTRPSALRPFQAIFREHAVERLYLAIVEGRVAPPAGAIDLRLVADRGDGRRGIARRPGEGVPAVTHYETIDAYGGLATRLACRLETGRTHQIRIHLAEIGHPVVGEPVYRPRHIPPFPIPFDRQALHAQALGFDHPRTGQPLRVEAPLPEDLQKLVGLLEHRHPPSGPGLGPR